MQAKREKNHNNSNHAPISTFTHNKIRSLSPVLAAPQPLAATGFEAIENARTMRNSKKRSRPAGLLLFSVEITPHQERPPRQRQEPAERGWTGRSSASPRRSQ